MSSALAGIRKSPAAPLLPGHAGHGLVGFQLCGLSVVCGLCRASILAGLAGMQGYASPLRSPGPSFPSAVIFRSFTRSDFAVSPSNSRQPCASGCGFPCALCIRKRAARTVLTGMCYSVGSATRQGSSSPTRFIGQSAMTSRT